MGIAGMMSEGHRWVIADLVYMIWVVDWLYAFQIYNSFPNNLAGLLDYEGRKQSNSKIKGLINIRH